MTSVAISYARFSSAQQAGGHSLARQMEAAEAYATANDMVVDRSLSFRDLGVSAWDKSNIQKGALGLFLKAVEAGKVPPGATLIVESFDRLSRAEPMDALPVFTTIINNGLKLVTLTQPPKLFSRDSIRANNFQLFEALIEMKRAHEESERKSQLLAGSWANRRSAAVETKRVMTSKTPLWIRTEGPTRNKTLVLIPERVAVVRRVIDLAMSGVGNHSIIKTLVAEGVQSWPRSAKEELARAATGATHHWEPSYIQKMLTHPALYGDVVVKGGITIEGYYPPVITKDEFVLLQARRSVRATRKTTNRSGATVTNLFSGLLKCGYCQGKCSIGGYTSKTGVASRYFSCHNARIGVGPCKTRGWDITELEKSLLFWITQIDYGSIVGNAKHGDLLAEQQALAVMHAEVQRLQTAIENGNIAIDAGVLSQIERVKQHEVALALVKQQAKQQQHKVDVLLVQEGGGASRMHDLVLLFKALKDVRDELPLRVLREQLSAAIAQVVERVDLYPRGHNGKESKERRFADITFKNGGSRRLEAGEC